MCCVVKFENMSFNFIENIDKQKLLLNTLLSSGLVNLLQISTILNVSTESIQNVCNGNLYFYNDTAENLGKLFLLAFSK